MTTPLPDEVLDRVFRVTRTANHYLDRPVPEEMVHRLWDLLRWGPTSANQEPARFVWCLSQASRDRLAACTSGTNDPKIRAAPAAVVIGMDLEFHEKLPKLFPHADARSWFAGNAPLIRESAFRNGTLQGAYFIVAARLLGLDTGPMSGLDAAKVDAAFFAGTKITTNFVATFGYGDFSGVLPRLPRLDFEEANSIL